MNAELTDETEPAQTRQFVPASVAKTSLPGELDAVLDQAINRINGLITNESSPSKDERSSQVSFTQTLPVTVARSSAANVNHGDDDALMAYVNKFMERMTGRPAEAPQPPPPPIAPAAPIVAQMQAAEESDKYREGAKPPECQTMMSRFREVAIQSAATAANTYAFRQHVRSAERMFYFGVGTSVVCSLLVGLSCLSQIAALHYAGELFFGLSCLIWLRIWAFHRNLTKITNELRPTSA